MSWYFWLFITSLGVVMLALACAIWTDASFRFSSYVASNCAKGLCCATVAFFLSITIGCYARNSELHSRLTLDKSDHLLVKNTNDVPVEVTYLADTLFLDGTQKKCLMPGEEMRRVKTGTPYARYKLLSIDPMLAKQPQDRMTVTMRYEQLTGDK